MLTCLKFKPNELLITCVTILILDVPSAPEDISVHDVFQDSCVLKWKKPKDDGGMPINQYIIERQDLSVKGI